MRDLIDAVLLADKLESGFASVADLLGPYKAFMVFATEVVKAKLDDETEEKFIRIIRLTYDEYVAEKARA